MSHVRISILSTDCGCSAAEIRINMDRMGIPYEPATIDKLVAEAQAKGGAVADRPFEMYNEKVTEAV